MYHLQRHLFKQPINCAYQLRCHSREDAECPHVRAHDGMESEL